MADRILIIVLAIALFLISLPKILRLLGFHPDYKRKDYNFEDKKALIITTSHDTLTKKWQTNWSLCFRNDCTLL